MTTPNGEAARSEQEEQFELACTGKLKGKKIMLSASMIASLSYRAAAKEMRVQLKKEHSGAFYCNQHLVGITVCGAQVTVEATQSVYHGLKAKIRV